jgi:DNA-binding YbaB/EbfC family protein
MFREFGQLAGLMGKLPKIREEMEKLQGRLGELTAEGQAGGGMVTIRVNGKFNMVNCTIAAEAVTDRELLEDLVVAATNQAMEKARQLVAAETSKMAGELGLPPGMNLPGLT